MDKQFMMGSLFAGIGGFDLAALEAGIKPVFSCEIEPYPRLVLSARFPDVRQYGDIRKLKGSEAPPVDIITFGSPCQSFSQAGARQGLDGASGLFYEAVRVIREMREATGGASPRYAVMENVPGIYSSKSSGKSDFREVLNELLKIKDKTVDVPLPEDGKFLTAGGIVGDGYSLAWRTLCASQFGVAQRRRRMFLVVDFTGGRAVEILSEPEGEGRDFTPGYLKGQGSAGYSAEGSGGVVAFEPGAFRRIDKSAWEEQTRTIRADMGDNQTAVAYVCPLDLRNATRVTDGGQGVGVGSVGDAAFTITAEYQHAVAVESHPQDGRIKICEDGVFPTVTQRFGSGGTNTHFVLAERKQCAAVTEDVVGAITAADFKGSPVYFEPATMKVRCGCEGGGKGALIQSDKSGALSCNNEQTLFEPCTYNICSDASNSMKSGNPDSGVYETETARTLDGNGGSPACNQGGTVITIQGSVLNRKDGNGPGGIGFREDKAYTVNTVDNGGAVCYQETAGALYASDFKNNRNQDNSGEKTVVENHYAVRRLTPLECLRLQGLPDGHLDNIHIAEPTAGQIGYWREVWKELGKIKTDIQIRKWLSDPYSDSNAYKAIGNSLAVPCALWVMRGIVENRPV
jgi:DNA (cytosine-5)-methyltransferase 1